MSKTKNAPDNEIINIQPEPEKTFGPCSNSEPEQDKKPRRRPSFTLQIAAKIDLLLQEAWEGKPDSDIIILDGLAKDRGYKLVKAVDTSEVFDRR